MFRKACEPFLLVVVLGLVLGFSGLFDYENEDEDEDESRRASSKHALSGGLERGLKAATGRVAEAGD